MGKRKNKRPHGTGSVYQNKKGGWFYSFRTPDGKRINRRAPTEVEAETRLMDLLDEHYPEILDYTEDVETIGEVLDRVLKDKGSETKQTTKAYYKYARRHLKTLEELPVKLLNSADVADWLSRLDRDGVHSQKRNGFDLLNQAMDFAVRVGLEHLAKSSSNRLHSIRTASARNGGQD